MKPLLPPAPPAPPAPTPLTLVREAARDTYLTAVQAAQRAYNCDVQAAVDAYHSAERLAWLAFNQTIALADFEAQEAARTGPQRPAAPRFTSNQTDPGIPRVPPIPPAGIMPTAYTATGRD